VTVRLEELLAAATPGPWEPRLWGIERDHWPDRRVSVGTTTGHGAAVCINPRYGELEQSKADAALIALTPDAVRLLIDTTKALRDVVEGSMWECPICGLNMEHDGHKEDCEYATLLARLDRLGNTT